jgi:hypothetical protein
MKRLALLLLVCSPMFGYSQTYWHYVMDTCTTRKSISEVFLKDSEIYVLACESETPTCNMQVCKIDSNLNFTEMANHQMIGYNYTISGGKLTEVDNGYWYYNVGSERDLMKLDSEYNIIWHRNFDDEININDPQQGFPSVFCDDPNSEFVYAAGSNSYGNAFQCLSHDLQIFKFSGDGHLVNTFSFPTLFMSLGNGCNYESTIPISIRVVDNEIEVIGWAAQNLLENSSVHKFLNYIGRFDLNGNLISMKFVGENSGQGVVLNDNNGYYSIRQEFVNEAVWTDSKLKIAYFPDLNSASQPIYESTEIFDYSSEYLLDPQKTVDGFVIGSVNFGNSNMSYGLRKFNSDLGQIEWAKTYHISLSLDNPADSIYVSSNGMWNLTVLPDQGYLFTGTLSYLNEIYPWIIRTDACGDELYNGCTVLGVPDSKATATISAYPNPTSSNLAIQLPTKDNWTVRLYNMNGQVVSTEKINGNNRLDLNLQNFTSGLYTVQAMNDNGKVYTEVVVKE